MRTTEGLTREYIDSRVVSIPLTEAGTEIGGKVVVASVELGMVVDGVDVCLVVHPSKVITIDKMAVIINNFLFIFSLFLLSDSWRFLLLNIQVLQVLSDFSLSL